ncbi:MAG TPA: response regulator [Nitrospirae bacterium]|nr:CAI-1 autoinducer sensor kinase/phosphatase CqsS [bacterium BMS3Abin10]GBE39588.1 CAI-1 autoinducer sensor kinase/phosphatase CqsS [bacterium BMS3Bbin08]HDH50123.1 response regulator [Nitrospirota bacterium]HDK41271.1 response regulator [Nitrospirota bacterium]HDK81478.1 response regulator [Nitrospirota bacterium]
MATKPKTVMVVDDEDVIRDILCTYLEKKGYKTVDLPDGQSAISYVEKKTPDVVLLDIKMPGMNGIKTCQKLSQALKPSSKTGIMMITGYGSPENMEKSFSSGAIDVIKKPFDLEDVNQRINIWFQVRNIEDELSRSLLYTEKVNWYLGGGIA